MGAMANDDDTRVSNYEKCKQMNFDFGSTATGKMPRCYLMSIRRPNSFYRDFKNEVCNARWHFSKEERLVYDSVIFYSEDRRYLK